jgi:hypothetical protein
MIKKELDALKYELYKKSWKSDYITYNQFVENQKVAYTFWELQNREKKRKSEKRVKKDLKNDTKWLYNSSNS